MLAAALLSKVKVHEQKIGVTGLGIATKLRLLFLSSISLPSPPPRCSSALISTERGGVSRCVQQPKLSCISSEVVDQTSDETDNFSDKSDGQDSCNEHDHIGTLKS